MSCAGNDAVLDGLYDGAAFFLGVGAFFVAASTDVGAELSECGHQIVLAHEIEALKIQHGEAWSVGEVATVGILGKRI